MLPEDRPSSECPNTEASANATKNQSSFLQCWTKNSHHLPMTISADESIASSESRRRSREACSGYSISNTQTPFRFVPYGLFGRLMVRIMSGYIEEPKFIWRNGLLIEQSGDKILIEHLVSQKKIQISVRGNVRALLWTTTRIPPSYLLFLDSYQRTLHSLYGGNEWIDQVV